MNALFELLTGEYIIDLYFRFSRKIKSHFPTVIPDENGATVIPNTNGGDLMLYHGIISRPVVKIRNHISIHKKEYFGT